MMDPAVLLRVIHDLQVKVFQLEAELEAARAPREVSLASVEDDAEVR